MTAGTHAATWLQEHIWRVEQANPGTPAFNVHVPVRLAGQLDLGLLAESLDDIVRRHDALWSSIVGDGTGGAVASLRDNVSDALQIVEVHGATSTERRRSSMASSTADAMRPFDLETSPPYRVTVLRESGRQHTLLLTLHHSAADAWSLGIIADELSSRYSQLRRGAPPSPRPPQFRSYARQQRARQPDWQAQLEYWEQTLEGATFTALPSTSGTVERPDMSGSSVHFRLSADISAGLKRLARVAASSLFVTLSAGVSVLVGAWAKHDDVTIGTRITNRPRAFHDAIGLFVNHLALRIDLSGDPTGIEIVRRSRTTAFGAYGHRDVPFELVADRIQIPQPPTLRDPRLHVIVQLLKFGRAKLDLPDVEVAPLDDDKGLPTDDLLAACVRHGSTGSSRYDLSLDFLDDQSGLWGRLDYNTHLFAPEVIELFLDDLKHVLAGMAEDPEARVSQAVRRMSAGRRRRT